MQVSFNRSELFDAFKLARAVGAQHVRLRADLGQAELIASNDNIWLRVLARSRCVDAHGECAIPTEVLMAALSDLQGSIKLRVEAEGDKATILTESGVVECDQVAGEEKWPTMSRSRSYYKISASRLRKMIACTMFAAAQFHSERNSVAGCLWKIEGGKLILVATDNKRLAICSGEGAAYGDVAEKARVVSRSTMEVLTEVLADTPGDVRVRFKDDFVFFQTDRAEMRGECLSCSFPPYERLLDGDHKAKASASTGRFLAACQMAAALGEHAYLCFENGKLTVEAIMERGGKAWFEIPAAYNSNKVSISVCLRTLIDALLVLPPDGNVGLAFTDQFSPIYISGGEDYTYVFLPDVLGKSPNFKKTT